MGAILFRLRDAMQEIRTTTATKTVAIHNQPNVYDLVRLISETMPNAWICGGDIKEAERIYKERRSDYFSEKEAQDRFVARVHAVMVENVTRGMEKAKGNLRIVYYNLDFGRTQVVLEFGVFDDSLPKSDGVTMHGSPTSQMMFNGGLLLSDGKTSLNT